MREFLELGDVDALMRVAQASNLVLRVDPYVMVYFYGLIFYMDVGRLDKRNVRRSIFQGLKDKLVFVKDIQMARSIDEFISEKLRE